MGERARSLQAGIRYMWLTLKQISQQVGVPESTLRRYRDLCESAVPTVGMGRGRMYPEEAAEVFRKIRYLREARHLEWSDIRKELGKRTIVSVPDEVGECAGGGDGLPPDVRYIGFRLNTVARQLLSVIEGAMKAQGEEIESVRRTVNLISRQNKKYRDELNTNLLMLLDKVTELQSGVAYLQKQGRRGEKGSL